MKKILTILLTIIMACFATLSFVGCNKQANDTIVVGVTDYEPLDYLENGKWVGFDAELAQKVFEDLGYKVVFQEIEWEPKIITLNSGEIDCIWNGMTINDELSQNLDLSDPYLTNTQYALVQPEKASLYTNMDSLNGKKVAVEQGSAAYLTVTELNCESIIQTQNQNFACLEVASGTSDVAIIDAIMALTLTKEGSSYYGKLTAVDLGFEKEYFAIGFRKADTELRDKVNAKLKELKQSGFTDQLAEKYNIKNALVK